MKVFLLFMISNQVMTNEGICLDALETFTANKQSSLARIVNCAETVRQKWLYNFKTQQIIQDVSGNCLTAVPNVETTPQPKLALIWDVADHRSSNAPNVESKFTVNAAPCTESVQQKWMLVPFQWK